MSNRKPANRRTPCHHPHPMDAGCSVEGPGDISVSWCPDCGALKRTMTNWKCTEYPWRIPKCGNRSNAKEDSDRTIRLVAAAHVAAMESGKLYLQNLHGELGAQWRSIGDRIESIDRQITAEKASVPNAPKSH